MSLTQRYSPKTLRSHGGIALLVGVLWVGLAAPLAAQDQVGTIRVDAPAVEITNEHPITNEINVNLPPADSAQVAREEAAIRAMEAIAACGCVESGGSGVSVARDIGLTLAAFFIGWQLKRIADRGPDVHNDGDTNVEVNLPEKKIWPHGEPESEGH